MSPATGTGLGTTSLSFLFPFPLSFPDLLRLETCSVMVGTWQPVLWVLGGVYNYAHI